MNASAAATSGKMERILFVLSLGLLSWALYQRFMTGNPTASSTRFVFLTAALVILGAGSLFKTAMPRRLALVASAFALIAFFVSLGAR
jgi:hypothetical protein